MPRKDPYEYQFANAIPFPDDCYDSGLVRYINRTETQGRGLGWPCILFYATADSDALAPCDQAGFIPTVSEWEEIRRRIDIYYQDSNAADIAYNNLEIRREHGLLPDPVRQPKIEKPRVLIPGHVYILSAENARHKIGRAKNLANRIKALRTASPLNFTIAHSIQSADTVRAESLLHRRFADKRACGEWFDLTSDDLAWVTSIADFALDGGLPNVQ